VLKEIPVNSVYVVQCDWDYPRLNYSLTNAMRYGWVFGIPLQDRISIGYLFNKEINTLEEIKEDIKNVFNEYNLIPSNKTNYLEFQSYYKTKNFNSKVIYNGNASFFIEPLEATSIGFSIKNTRNAIAYWLENLNKKSTEELQEDYLKNISDISAMISLHYLARSKYNTEFWKYAESKATEKIKKEFENETEWSKFIWSVIMDKHNLEEEIGTWGAWNYKINIDGLGIKDKLIEIRNSTKSIIK
jgi:tryptophan halogenase